MTKKNYRALAAGFVVVRPMIILPTSKANERSYIQAHAVWDDCVAAVADVLKADNPAFDRAKFEEACLA